MIFTTSEIRIYTQMSLNALYAIVYGFFLRLPSLRQASVSEEHRALMATVVEKVLSAKSGLNEAFTSLLRGFEVCDVMLSIG